VERLDALAPTGYEYAGAEVGISTDKLHARGPVGLEGLTTQSSSCWPRRGRLRSRHPRRNFDPVHAHLAMARAAMRQLDLDSCSDATGAPRYRNPPVAPAEDRVACCG